MYFRLACLNSRKAIINTRVFMNMPILFINQYRIVNSSYKMKTDQGVKNLFSIYYRLGC